MSYLYQNARSGAYERLRALERLEDADTISALLRLPEIQGLDCLEVGAGTGSIAAWLAQQVGPAGTVLATDIDITHLDGSSYSVRQHDILRDELPRGAFDLVHIRHVLIHLAAPAEVLKKIRGCMRPGAHLLVEESDLRSWSALGDPASQHNREFQHAVAAILRLYTSRGMDVGLGAALAQSVREAGFLVLDESPVCRDVAGFSAEATYQKLSTLQLAASLAGEQPELSRMLRDFAPAFDSPALRYRSRTTVRVTARNPANV